MRDESPRRPGALLSVPPVEVPAAILPRASSATAPTVSCGAPWAENNRSGSSSPGRDCSRRNRSISRGMTNSSLRHSTTPCSAANCSAPAPTKYTCGLSSRTSRAARIGLRMCSTQPTPPARRVAPSMSRASSCTRPSRVRKLPRPASKVSSSSMMTIASTTASSAVPPRLRTFHPASSACFTPATWAATMPSGMAQAPPWTTSTGFCFNGNSSGGEWLVRCSSSGGVVSRYDCGGFRLLIRVLDSMGNCDVRKHGNDPQHWRHAVENGSNDHQDQPLRAFHKADLASSDQRLGSRPGVADHHRPHHHDRNQNQVEETVCSSVINQQSEEQGHIAIAIHDRVEERTKTRNLIRGARYASVHQVKETRSNDDQAGVEEHPSLILSRGVSEQNCRHDVNDQPHEREDVGRNPGQGHPINDGHQQHPARFSKGPCPSHSGSSCIVVRLKTSSSRLPVGVTTVAVSPTFLLMSARPIGEVVEIRPFATSDSSLVTSRYSISVSFEESYTFTLEPSPALSLGMLFRLMSE